MIKKKIKKGLLIPLFAVIMGLGGTFQSCNFLDIDPYITDLLTLDTVFQNRVYAERYLRNVYSYLTQNNCISTYWHDNFPYTAISDEVVSGYKRDYHAYNYFANNQITSDNIQRLETKWNGYYEGIRKANTFIIRINECPELTAYQKSAWIAEARFLKATFYFDLMLAWGPVPIVPDTPLSADDPLSEMMIPRSTWDECTDYVLSQLELAIPDLPNEYQDTGEIGKPTKSSALALMSRLSLYTASPAFNGQTDFPAWKNKQGVNYFNTVYDEEKYAKAAAYAKRLIDLDPTNVRIYTAPARDGSLGTPNLPAAKDFPENFPNGVGGIDPYHSYSDMFNGTILPSQNSEILFVRPSSKIEDFARYLSPGAINGWGVFSLTQNLVDDYYMADGTTIDNTSYPQQGYSENDSIFSGVKDGDGVYLAAGTHNWYMNREPRFYATIGFCGSYWPSISTPENQVNKRDGRFAKFYADSESGKGHALDVSSGESEEYPMAGYLCKKFYHPEDSWFGRRKSKYTIVYRMAEVYLNYVEAMNELTKSYTIGDVTVSRDEAEMKRCFNLIRFRAGLPGITDADVADVQKMRRLIERERRVEFAMEERRYFDCRRNKTASKYENAPVMGCDVSKKEAEKDQFFTKVRVRERVWTYKVFTPRQTFFPIYREELDRNTNLDQLPGY